MESKNYQEDLSHIRSMMERSSRFISLSGLSGVFAGLVALLGAGYVYYILKREGIDYFEGKTNLYSGDLVSELVLAGFVILVLAILSGYIFTAKKSKEKNGYENTKSKLKCGLSRHTWGFLRMDDG